MGKEGTLSVVKDLGLKEPYCGQIPIASGEIAEDIASYFATSEQIPTVCGLGVLVNPDLTVKAAGGYLIQLLPFADEGVIDTLEKNVNALPSVTQMLSSGVTAEDMAMKVLEGLQPNVMDRLEASYKCDCSRERVETALISIGKRSFQIWQMSRRPQRYAATSAARNTHLLPTRSAALQKKQRHDNIILITGKLYAKKHHIILVRKIMLDFCIAFNWCLV